MVLAGLGLLAAIPLGATEPNAETNKWWAHVRALADDSMRGRDTGSPEHRKAQEYVVRQFEKNGIQAAGEQGYFQSVSLRQLRLQPQRSEAVLTRGGRTQPLRWLQQISTAPLTGLPAEVAGDLVFVGSDNGAALDTDGKTSSSSAPCGRGRARPAAAPGKGDGRGGH